jgi:hypothetical protein
MKAILIHSVLPLLLCVVYIFFIILIVKYTYISYFSTKMEEQKFTGNLNRGKNWYCFVSTDLTFKGPMTTLVVTKSNRQWPNDD